MSLPTPEPGLVVRYSYLWLHEHREGREEGTKDRPCAIILATRNLDDHTHVVVVPVTHSPPANLAEALELPAPVKQHLGLDSERSWIVLSESNLFAWPGPDLRRVGDQDNSSVAYGFLPPRLRKIRGASLEVMTGAAMRRTTDQGIGIDALSPRPSRRVWARWRRRLSAPEILRDDDRLCTDDE